MVPTGVGDRMEICACEYRLPRLLIRCPLHCKFKKVAIVISRLSGMMLDVEAMANCKVTKYGAQATAHALVVSNIPGKGFG